MAKINISEEMVHLENLCKQSNSNIIIFTFEYNCVNFKCVYMYKANAILLAAKDYNVGFNVRVTVKGEFDNYLSNVNYNLLKQIYKNCNFKTKILCNNMLKTIKQLKLKDVNINSEGHFYRNVNISENEKIYFKCWARNKVRHVKNENLEKTRKYFGEEVYEICKRCNISSRWKSQMTVTNILKK
ncbi:hypothetical protein GKZ28_14620 [Clostridium chromiireducens]|uniref:Uncharacterized protein n=1 Tax=Clostridium chromiireducens TaxID=225345 RepID=A0A964W2V5_9CLOT|nr:hypothetical protein [Clostridium chromiireducens]MVX64926.1 hypothetical protein [Clostridium chromiireducens]